MQKAKEIAPLKLASQLRQTTTRYTEHLHPVWKSIASDIIPSFNNEIITQHMFVYCINKVFIESEQFAYLSYRKREMESMLTVVKMRMFCQIPLTQLRKKLMLAAMQHFADKCRRIRILNFIYYIMNLVENEQEVDPAVEVEMLAPALSLLIRRTARRGWSKMKLYNDIVTKNTKLNYHLSPHLQLAVSKTISETHNDVSLVSVTSALIDNIQKQRLARKTRNFFIK